MPHVRRRTRLRASSPLERPQRQADPGHDRIPRPLLRLRIDEVEAMDRAIARAREITAAVIDEAVPVHGDRKERRRDPPVIERALLDPQVLADIGGGRIAGLVVAGVYQKAGTTV